MLKSSYIVFVVFIVLMSCSPGAVPTSTDSEKYKEDLAYLRPTYPDLNDTTSFDTQELEDYSDIKPRYDVTAKLNSVLDSIDVIRKNRHYVDGFTIQVYSGYNSEEATIARGKVYSILEGSRPSLKFEEPNFMVKVGRYYSKLEAQKDYSLIRARFPSALILPQRIYIND